jgi:hypothetical protein
LRVVEFGDAGNVHVAGGGYAGLGLALEPRIEQLNVVLYAAQELLLVGQPGIPKSVGLP